MNKEGLLVVVSGPSGCGKGTVLEQVLAQDENLHYSVSTTTREPREGEQHGKNYYFVSKEEFLKLLEMDEILELTTYVDNYYGTPRRIVTEELKRGKDVILEIETDGAMQIRQSYPNAVFIFILPPSLAELERRLRKRGTESEERVQARLKQAMAEIAQAYKYDYVIVNGALEETVLDLQAAIRAEKNTTKRMITTIDEVLENA